MLFHFFWPFRTHPQTGKHCFTNGFPFLLIDFVDFSASRRQKKWNSIGFIRVERFWVPSGRPKEMDFHWFYKVFWFSKKSPKRQSLVLPMLFHFFWPLRAHPQTGKPCFTNGFPFLLIDFVDFSAPRREKKWNSIGLQGLSEFGCPPGGQKK